MQALESAHLLPKSVHDLLADATAAGLCGPSCSGSSDAALAQQRGGGRGGSGAPSAATAAATSTYGWVLHRGTLLVWRTEDDLQAAVRRLQLPQAPTGRVFVSVLPHAASTALTVVLCTADGLLCVWLDANFFAPPYTQQLFVAGAADASAAAPVFDAVTAMAAGTVDAAGAPGFAAVVATADGALHLYHGSQQGIFPRQFHRPAAGGGAAAAAAATGGGDASAGGLLGSIGVVVKALYSEAFDPLYRVQRPAASRLPARQLILLRAGGAGAAGAAWRLLALTADALDCWALGAANAASAADERLMWSFNLGGVLLGELGATEVEPLALAAAWPHTAAASAPHGGDGAQQLLVWSSFTAADSLAQQHALSLFDLRSDTIPGHERTLVISGPAAAALPRPSTVGGGAAAGWRLLAHPRVAAALARAPNGTVVEWVPATDAVQVRFAGVRWRALLCESVVGGSKSLPKISVMYQRNPPTPCVAIKKQVLASSRDNLDAASSGAAALWQVLNSRYGALLMGAGGQGGAGAAGAAAAAPGGCCLSGHRWIWLHQGLHPTAPASILIILVSNRSPLGPHPPPAMYRCLL
jgi:hypothetical protein